MLCWYNGGNYAIEKDFAMNHPKNPKFFLALAAGLGILGLVLGRLLYALALDDRGLLVRGHFLSFLLCLVIPASLGLALLALPGRQEEIPADFPQSPWAALGHCLAAVCIVATVLTGDPGDPNLTGKLWQILGLLAALGLLVTGWQRYRGKAPGFAGFLALCLFLLSHIISHYAQWCADPQILDYLFEMLGVGLWMLFAYYLASCCVGLPKPRMQLATGLMALTLCLTAMGTRAGVWMCLGGAIFSGACLYRPGRREDAP